jgi:hypothetical protein
MIGEFIALLFLSREVAHRAHLATTSYSQHMALGAFYEGIVPLVDTLAEAYQGRNGLIDDIPILDRESPADILETLTTHLAWVEANRYEAAPKEDSTLQNIIDEIISLYLSTLYKLKNLK